MKTLNIKSCEDCPFAKWQGYYYPVEMACECPGAPKEDTSAFVFSRASGWWYKTPPAFCPLRTDGGVRFKVEESVEIGK